MDKLMVDGRQVIDIVSRGDLIAVLGEHVKHPFRVDSTVLARSSPFFRALLHGPWAEGQNQRKESVPWVVKFPDDDPECLYLALRILHGHFAVETTLTLAFDDLYHLCVITDKYDLTHILRPWVKRWRADLGESFQGKSAYFLSSGENATKLIWICWELCHTSLLERILGLVAWNFVEDFTGSHELYACQEEFDMSPFGLYEQIYSLGLSENVSKIRENHLCALQELFIFTANMWSHPNAWLFAQGNGLFSVQDEDLLKRYFELWINDLDARGWHYMDEFLARSGRPMGGRFLESVGGSASAAKEWYMRTVFHCEERCEQGRGFDAPAGLTRIPHFFRALRGKTDCIRPRTVAVLTDAQHRGLARKWKKLGEAGAYEYDGFFRWRWG